MVEGNESSEEEKRQESRDAHDEGRSNNDSGDRGSGEDLCHNSKMRRTEGRDTVETVEEDRFSDLPDAIILHILSFSDTKDAIRTGTLSKRWLYLWTSVPNLLFHQEGYNLEYELTCKFVAFVDQTLILHKGSPITDFVVCFEYNDSFASTVDRWVRFATRANVKNLSLHFEARTDLDFVDMNDDDDHYLLPRHLYRASSMTEMTLQLCDVAPKGVICWKSLKKLYIESTKMSEDAIPKILVGSPLLEVLALHRFYGFNRLDIDSTSLKRLTISDYSNFSETLEILAPNLESLVNLEADQCTIFG